jgi:hypothetical protein
MVVPYSPYLSLKFNCHINVEVVQSIKAIKYLYKYTHKGPDRAKIKLYLAGDKKNSEEPKTKDEIKKHVSCRYVGPSEALWRIFENRLHHKSHAVQRLSIHLPDQQSVCFADNATRKEIEEAMEKDSHLIAWFKLNEACEKRFGKNVARTTAIGDKDNAELEDEEVDIDDAQNDGEGEEIGPAIGNDFDSRQLLFTEIPRFFHFVDHQWIRRKRQSKCIARMYTVNPTSGDKERFYLRLILLRRRGATGNNYIKALQS